MKSNNKTDKIRAAVKTGFENGAEATIPIVIY